jgi:hypothetical protein
VKHFASSAFWECYEQLPANIREQADRSFDLLKVDPHHPSLHFKKAGKYRSVRIGPHYRVLAVEAPDGFVWFWVGIHSEYERLLS